MIRTIPLLAALALVFTAPACGKDDKSAGAASAGAQKMHPQAQKKWVSLCVNCHAENGSGKGPGSKTLNPKPRDFRSVKWQEAVTDEHLKKVIIKGGAAMGLSKDMPPNPELVTQNRVVADLIKKIRSLKGQDGIK